MDRDTKRNELVAEMMKVNEKIDNMKNMEWREFLEGDLMELCIKLTELLNDY